MERDGGVLRMSDPVDCGADVVPAGGQVHVWDGVARARAGHVAPRSRAHRLLPRHRGLRNSGSVTSETDTFSCIREVMILVVRMTLKLPCRAVMEPDAGTGLILGGTRNLKI